MTRIEDPEDIVPNDLRAEAQSLEQAGEEWEAWLAAAYNEEGITILWLPAVGRAGIAWGSDAEWTEADSAQDALARFLGEDDKEMVN